MPPLPPPLPPEADGEPVDLLIVGGLTVDHFPDGSRAAGGTVLHGARAARAAGLTLGIVTIAGEEPEARAAVTELGDLAGRGRLSVQEVARSIAFRHDEADGQRTLTLLNRGARMTAAPRTFRPLAVLYGPVAAELAPDFAGQAYDGGVTAATLQGWLRSLEPGRRVTALGLDRLETALVARLATCDLLVASAEDLAAVASDPARQLGELRRRVGSHPILALTQGGSGAILEAPDGRRLTVAPPRSLVPGSTIGAGDAFASVLVAHLATRVPLRAAAEAAAAAAAAYLAWTPRRAGNA